MTNVDLTIQQSISLCVKFEGVFLKPYICPAGVATIGIGATKYADGTPVKMTDPAISSESAMLMLGSDIKNIYLPAVMNRCKGLGQPNQLAAMCSLTYNIGIGAFTNSSVLRAHNRGDFMAAGRAFALFDKARVKGELKVMKGLTRRRAEESAIYLSSLPGPAIEPMPQAVEPESKMTASPINKASVIAGVSAIAAGANEINNAIIAVKTGVASLGDWLVPALLVTIVVACCFVVYQRYKQRKFGWA